MPTLKGISQSVGLFLTRKREECKEKVLPNTLLRNDYFGHTAPLQFSRLYKADFYIT